EHVGARGARDRGRVVAAAVVDDQRGEVHAGEPHRLHARDHRADVPGLVVRGQQHEEGRHRQGTLDGSGGRGKGFGVGNLTHPGATVKVRRRRNQVPDALRLDGKVAVVTGASRGLGRVAVSALAAAGADVALLARTATDLAEAAREVEAAGRRSLVLPTDATEDR